MNYVADALSRNRSELHQRLVGNVIRRRSETFLSDLNPPSFLNRKRQGCGQDRSLRNQVPTRADPQSRLPAPLSAIPITYVSPLFHKNAFAAVTNEEDAFLVCRLLRDARHGEAKVHIWWLRQIQSERRLYRVDYNDNIDSNSIFTTVGMEWVGKCTYELPNYEWRRTDTILQEALDVAAQLLARSL